MAGRQWLKAVSGVLLGLGVCVPAHAGLYVYELPGGTRLRTDHALDAPYYRLVRAGARPRARTAAAGERNPAPLPAGAAVYDELIRRVASEHGIDFALVKAVVHVESLFDPDAKSHKGARGLMQLMPATARHYAIDDIDDPVQNVGAGVKHLRYLLRRFDDRQRLALAAYNAGETAVRRYRGVPPYPETRAYVRKVMAYRRHYTRASVSVRP